MEQDDKGIKRTNDTSGRFMAATPSKAVEEANRAMASDPLVGPCKEPALIQTREFF